MSPSRAGARKAAGQRLVAKGYVQDLATYLSRMIDGDRWCSACKTFHPREMMGVESARPGGRAGVCRKTTRRVGSTQ